MAKSAVEVKQDILTKVIADLEASQTFPNLNALWNEAAKKYNETPGVPTPITFSVVYQRVKSWNIPIKTQPGKKRGGTNAATTEGGEPETADTKPVIQVSDKVRVVRQDKYNVIIERNVGGTWKHTGSFFATFQDALARLLESSVPGEVMTAKSLIEAWNACTKRLSDAVASSGLMKSEPATVSEDEETEESDDA